MVGKLLASNIVELENSLNKWFQENQGITIHSVATVSVTETWVCLLILYQPSAG